MMEFIIISICSVVLGIILGIFCSCSENMRLEKELSEEKELRKNYEKRYYTLHKAITKDLEEN